VNLSRAIRALKRERKPTPQLKKFRSRVFNRFVEKTEQPKISVKDPLVREVLYAYRKYYRDALLNPKMVAKFNEQLLVSLNTISIGHGVTSKKQKFDAIEEVLRQAFTKRGLSALFGTVSPFKSLLLWRRERKKKFNVQLLESRQVVKVVFLEDFVELGWLHYATFGKYYVGGWAKSDALYCVAQAYRRGGDRFHASYLCHEAQHYSDYKRFPKLQQQDLEYRAKLAELIASKRPKKLIKKFSNEAKDNKLLPHSYAAFCLLKNFDQKRLNVRDIRRSAVASLAAHSRALKEKGPRTVKSALP
jgi:hypothetical protein